MIRRPSGQVELFGERPPSSARRPTWRSVDDAPPGLVYRPNFLAPDEERTTWQHSLCPVRALRYSITFRTVKRRAAADDT